MPGFSAILGLLRHAGIEMAGVFTRDLGLSLADDLDGGSVIINGSNAWRIDTMPFGGTGMSGFGREGVRSMVAELTAPKVIVVRRRPAS